MCTKEHTDRSHLSQEDRAVIEALRANGATIRSIADVVHRHYSTICREILRNSETNVYTARIAQKRYFLRRLAAKQATRKIENNPILEAHIEQWLRGGHIRGNWSPAVIAHFTTEVCHQTIYSWVRRSRSDLRRLLPRCGKYRRRYGSLKAPSRGWTTKIRTIETRPEEVQNRSELGHYEGDTIHLNRSKALLTVVERKSKFLIADLLTAHVGMAYEVHLALVSRLSVLPSRLRKTITQDRGGEFAYWDMTEAEIDGLSIYFAHPHAPWERGTNEHTNGLLRRYFPKKEKHDTITAAHVAEVVWMINHRPRKSLNWETPCKVFGACCTSS